MHRRRLIGALSLAAVAAPVAVPAAALSVSRDRSPGAVAAQSGSQTIVQVAAGDPRFTTLVSLVKRAGLAKTLSSGHYTVFAPTDRAFAKVPKATLAALAKDKAALRSVLLYHVVAGAVPASKVITMKSVKTLQGARVRIAVHHGTVRLNRTAKVVQADVMASNGVVHVINRVLLPPRG